MSVYQNLYFFMQTPMETELLKKFSVIVNDQSMVSCPCHIGPAFKDRDFVEENLLQTPELAEPERFQYFSNIEDAISALIKAGEGMISASISAQCYRSEPSNFYDWPSSLGLYIFPNGYNLTIGESEDFSDVDPDFTNNKEDIVFSGKIYWLIWIHGKNSPLIEDFIGSPLHAVLKKLWSNASIYDDQWL